MVRRAAADEDDGSRQHERENCVFYSDCLRSAARGTIRNGGTRKSGSSSIPCRDCPRYKPEEPHRLNPWQQPNGYIPWGSF
jgi:hypothetical protein